MSEETLKGGAGVIEAEIAELSQLIDKKRKLLEEQKGIVEDKEVVRQAVGERISSHIPTGTSTFVPVKPAQTTQTTKKVGASYLDDLDGESIDRLNHLLGIVFDKGIKDAVGAAMYMEPFMLDALHDALVEKFYDELKKLGKVK
jgi:hypothetical protein